MPFPSCISTRDCAAAQPSSILNMYCSTRCFSGYCGPDTDVPKDAPGLYCQPCTTCKEPSHAISGSCPPCLIASAPLKGTVHIGYVLYCICIGVIRSLQFPCMHIFLGSCTRNRDDLSTSLYAKIHTCAHSPTHSLPLTCPLTHIHHSFVYPLSYSLIP